MSCFFVYGSLQDERVLRIVIKTPVEKLTLIPATLSGYSAKYVVNEDFPVLVEDSACIVNGLHMSGLSSEDCERIHFYESSDYACKPVVICSNIGEEIRTRAFFPKEKLIPGDETWNFEDWKKRDVTSFLKRIEEYMCHFGTAEKVPW